MTDHRRSSWLLLALVALAILTVPAAAWAQGAPGKTTATGCEFNKRQAIEANGGPLGKAIWGRLCQVIDGKPTMAEGARLTASQDGEQVAAVTTGPDGVFVLPIPGNGTFAVVLDPATLPKGFSLTSAKESTLGQVSVQLGDQQATFRLGADTRGTRTFSDYATTAVKGLRIGLVLAVAAVGLSLVYGVTGLVNFAHAELVTLGAITAYVATKAGIPFWLALPVAAAVGAGLGWGNEVLLWRPLRKRRMGLLSMMVVSIGLGIAVRNMLQVLFGPDGRLVYSTTVSAATRVNPLFDHVNQFQSIGESAYNAFTTTLTKRMQKGFQAQATYTLARGVDNAPLTGTYVVASGDDRLSDPTNLDRDKGVTPFNQVHTVAISTVYQPTFSGDGIGTYLANHNQFGIIIQANSGLPFNIRSNRDLNGDGVNNDRPLGVERNSGRLGTVFNVDLRYSRYIPLTGRAKGELFVEAKNLFNRQNIAGVNRVVATDAAGNATVDISNVTATGTLGQPFTGTSGYDQRVAQVGVKVSF